ncbi:M20/M25/M40 family metallo-hydrolase [Niabella ginsengisoli]|uniref:Carboxypeptidase Q n=1 Tax=Niabella ginsengisoli TaxID=522298 RepID=A0ABS9SR94_9BACT|nr:M20/M25/M40 family metallo-hydrolase [Niabella ginsengisoli]MCH5600913.1 M20/M25/M40 family metallo-hydrolase [Niabella ginsengisoli]
MKRSILLPFLLSVTVVIAQKPSIDKDAVVDAIVTEATQNSQLEVLGHELLDGIGPRLVGTPEMKQAGDWAIEKYKSWGIAAHSEKWGEWRGWQRGPAHFEMTYPRVKSLEGMQLAWSPGTNGKTVSTEVIILPAAANGAEFEKWLSTVKGKFVMISLLQPTGRPDKNWEEFGIKESVAKMNKDRDSLFTEWTERISKTGYTSRTLPVALENAGALGVITNNWSKAVGADKIFGAYTKQVPTIDLSLEDYGLVYRLAQSGKKPKMNMTVESKMLPPAPTFNIIAEIKGVEKPDEYVILSAHFDSWDGATGATDNGTGTLTMMEAARILKKVYPNPKRTILVGHWGSEEQGLNGSRAFVEDHPEIVANIQAVFNQDNGTGRVTSLQGMGFLHSYNYLSRWLSKVPQDVRKYVETSFPGQPGTGGSDFASFVMAGAPAFSLSSLSWDYGTITWHTNRDTYDKIVFDDLRNNAILTTAVMAYAASEDPEKASREQVVLPVDPSTGKPREWPKPVAPTRRGDVRKRYKFQVAGFKFYRITIHYWN